MTLVNTITGEVLDAEAAERRASYICSDLDSAADVFESAMDKMRAAIRDRDDLALGYRSPGDYLSDRFGGRLARLGVDLRREVVRELTEAGLSTRAIAPVVGANFSTVSRDRARVADATPQSDVPSSLPTSGRPSDAPVARQPQESVERSTPAANQPEGEVTSDSAPVTPTTETQEEVARAPRPPAPVVGIDGKTYTRPLRAVRTDEPGRTPQQQNAEEFAARFAGQVVSLLSLQHDHMRRLAREQWSAGHMAASPVQRSYVSAQNIRAVADGLSALADEWEDH